VSFKAGDVIELSGGLSNGLGTFGRSALQNRAEEEGVAVHAL
jgi:hypothetical protein